MSKALYYVGDSADDDKLQHAAATYEDHAALSESWRYRVSSAGDFAGYAYAASRVRVELKDQRAADAGGRRGITAEPRWRGAASCSNKKRRWLEIRPPATAFHRTPPEGDPDGWHSRTRCACWHRHL